MARREFLQLAKTFKPGKDNPAGMWISEKLDGCRCFWDGGTTRGLPTTSVPWANTINPKTGKQKAKIKPVSTGLWSRYGNPIIAPDWWLNQLPAMFLDGELFAGRGNFQTLRSIVAKDIADEEAWKQVQFACFGAPSPTQVFAAGEIKNPNFHLTVDTAEIMKFMLSRADAGVMEDFLHIPENLTFEDELYQLQTCSSGDLCYLHHHFKLSDNNNAAEEQMGIFVDGVLDAGGEGVVLREPRSIWTPKRVGSLLKLKPFEDDQGTVTGFVSGRETDKGSKLRGLIGALVLDYKGKRLELSGFTDAEREFATSDMRAHAWDNPGKDMPASFQGARFKVGDTVEFRYRELSDASIPKEARFHRGV